MTPQPKAPVGSKISGHHRSRRMEARTAARRSRQRWWRRMWCWRWGGGCRRELQSSRHRGRAAAQLRRSDRPGPARHLDQCRASRALYHLHAANTGRGVHVFTSMLPPTNLQRPAISALGSGAGSVPRFQRRRVAGSVAVELESRKLPNATLVAPLRPMNNIAAPAIAVEIAPPGDDVEDIASAEYQEQVAQSIAAGVAAVRSKLPETRP